MAASQQPQPIPPSPKPTAPTPQEIIRKLGSPTEPVPHPSTAPSTSLGSASNYLSEPGRGEGEGASSGGVARRGSSGSNVSRRPSQSSVTSDEEPPSPSRPNLGLHSISEASSGSDVESDASSSRSQPRTAAAKQTITKGLEKLKLAHSESGSSGRLRAEGEKEMEADKKSGYLMKKGERRKAWKKRWFVIRGGQLAMYKNDKEYQLLRLIPLSSIHSCSAIEMKKHSFTFGIVTPNRTYYVEASSSAEVDSWCKAIDRARAELNSAATVTSLDTPTPAESGQITPHAGTNAPRSPAEPTKAIPMVPRANSNSVERGPGGQSYASTTITSASPSPPTPFSPPNNSLLSSSLTSNNTNSTNSQIQNTTRVPPNSLAAGGLLSAVASTGSTSIGGLELEGVDDQLLRVQRGRESSFSSNAPSSSSPMMGASSVQSQASYFSSSPQGHTGGSLFPPGSPGIGGIISSSEDEGEDEPGMGGAGIMRSASMGPSPSGQLSGFGDPNKVILSGYLMKQGKRKNWRKRWFVLMSGRLVYSRSHMDTKVHRQIPLTRILDAMENTASSPPQGSQQGASANQNNPPQQFEHCFKIITPKRTYLVCAPTEEDEIKWLAALQCLVARKTTAPQGPLPPIQTIPATPPPVNSPPTRSESFRKASSTPLQVLGRQRSTTDAARAAVKDVERRFHPTSPGAK